METMDPTAAEQLRSIIERVERLEGEKADIAADIKEVYGEAKSQGFDTKILRTVIRLRKLAANERMEIDEITALYRAAVGV